MKFFIITHLKKNVFEFMVPNTFCELCVSVFFSWEKKLEKRNSREERSEKKLERREEQEET